MLMEKISQTIYKLKTEGGEYNEQAIELLQNEFKLKLSGDKAKDDKKILGAYIKYLVQYSEPISDPSARRFYETVLPDDPGCYWLFASNKDAYVNRVYKSKSEYIDAILKLCQCDEFNLFYSFAKYYFKHQNDNVISIKCLAIDIDNFDDPHFKPMEKSDEELIDYIRNTFPLLKDQMCNILMASGHGMHMYWFLKEEIPRYTFEEYQKHLITSAHGDLACVPSSHYWRCLFSYNVKQHPIQTRVIPVSFEPISLEQMDIFRMPEDEIDAYRKKENAARAEKARATRIKNGTCAKPKEKKTAKEKAPKKEKVKVTKKVSKKPKITDNTIDNIQQDKSPNLQFYTDFGPYQDINLVKDLHNYYVRRLQQTDSPDKALEGCRNFFAFIMTNYLKDYYSLQECMNFCLRYFSKDFQPEAKSVIEKTYYSQTKYFFRYSTLAKELNFTEEDYLNSFNNFSDSEDKRRLKNNTKAKLYYKRKHRQRIQEKQNIVEYIKNNMNVSTKIIAKQFRISERTAYRIKRMIRNSD